MSTRYTVCKHCGGYKEETKQKRGGVSLIKKLLGKKIKLVLENKTDRDLYGAFYKANTFSRDANLPEAEYEKQSNKIESVVYKLPKGKETRIDPGPPLTAVTKQYFRITSDPTLLTPYVDDNHFVWKSWYVDIGANIRQRYNVTHVDESGGWDNGLRVTPSVLPFLSGERN